MIIIWSIKLNYKLNSVQMSEFNIRRNTKITTHAVYTNTINNKLIKLELKKIGCLSMTFKITIF